MHYFIGFLFLTLSYTIHASQFTSEDMYEISKKLNDVKNIQRYDDYIQNILHSLDDNNEQIQHFRLESGIDVDIPYNILKAIKDSHYFYLSLDEASNFYSSSNIPPFTPTLTQDFEEYSMPKEYMEDVNSKSTMNMRKQYGKLCNEKFDHEDTLRTKIAFLYPNKDTYLKNGHYKIIVDKSSVIQDEKIKSVILNIDQLSDYKIKFRYMLPNNTGNKFVLFFETTNMYMNDLGQEGLIGSFTVEQVIKEF